MTLRHMRIFAEVYRTRNVTHAAQNLHMTQPAVTRAIQELEQHYGVRLFERLYRHLSSTEAAQRLYAQAVYLLDTFDHMEAAMRDWDSLAWCGWGQRSRWAAPSFRCWPAALRRFTPALSCRPR